MNLRKYYHKIKSVLGLSLQLAKAGFKLKNEGSYLGILWYLLDPLFMFIILLFIRNLVAKGIENYPLYLLLGLVMFNFFRKTTSDCVGSITENSDLIKSIKINQEVFVISKLLSNVFSHFFEIILFTAVLFFLKVPLLNMLFYIPIFAFFCFFVLGVSFLVSTFGTYIFDFTGIWNIFTRILWFATPIFYSSKLNLSLNVNSLNPLYYFISIARQLIIYGKIPDWQLISGMILFSFIFFLLGIFIFERFKDKFAEKI